ncbi:MAG: NAD-dependent epimerase/dehydratase family protein [Methylovirgula sp.]
MMTREPTQEAKLLWVTAATSYLGCHVARRLADRGYDVVGMARRPVEPGIATQWGFKSVEIGPFAPELLRTALDRYGAPKAVFHAVGSGSVGQAAGDPSADAERTIGSVEVLIGLLQKYAPEARLIYASSAAVYGICTAGPMPESTVAAPISIYGRNKLRAEELCQSAGLDVVIARFFSVYGSPQKKLLFWDIGKRLLDREATVTLNGTGDEARDFIHVSDAGRAIASLVDIDVPPAVINIGTGIATPVRVATKLLASALSVSVKIEFNGIVRPEDPPHQQADIARLHAIGVVPEVDLEAGLREYAAWLLEQRL